MRKQNFYFSLDSLVDTRIGLLMQHWPERVNAIDFAKYRNRRTSYVWEYFGITKEDWEAKWNKRDAELLTYSGPTEMVLRLTEMFIPAMTNFITSQSYEQPMLVVNTWPYRLESWEIEQMAEGLRQILITNIAVEIVYIPLEELKPAYIKARWDVVVMYDIVEWLACHQTNLTIEQMPAVVVHYPAVINDGTEDSIKENSQVTPFTQLRVYLAEYACFDALDVNLWCLPPVTPSDLPPRP